MRLGGTSRIRRVGGLLLVAAALTAAAPVDSPARSPAVKAAAVGTITYFSLPTLERDPYWITVGPDGNLWFTDVDASRIGRITPTGRIREFRIGNGKRPKTIVTGPDGNLWFTESNADKIGVMSRRGRLLDEFAVPTSGATPWGIAVGPDRNIWFAEQGTGEDVINNVGRVIVEGPDRGLVTEFPLHPCACNPIGVTTGPDGNLWATEELGVHGAMANGTVDRLSPDGQTIDRFPIDDDEQALPGYLAPGPDGNVWFGAFNATRHMIGSITPDGDVTEYTVPVTNATVNAVTTGPDGNLWFTTAGIGADNTVRNMAPDGMFLDDYRTHQTPIGLTVGPDGNIWFASGANGEIGRLQIARPNRRYVVDIASGFVPARRTVRVGTIVQWMFQAPGDHRVSDSTGLELFDSDALPPASRFSNRFSYAGTFAYEDPTTDDEGRIAVGLRAPRSGRVARSFTVRWGTTSLPTDLAFDVQIKRPQARSWSNWRPGTSALSHEFTPHGSGRFRFRARVREAPGPGRSGWSPPDVVTVR